MTSTGFSKSVLGRWGKGRLGGKKALVNRYIIVRHAAGTEPFFQNFAAAPPAQYANPLDGPNGVIQVFDQVSRDAVFDDFGHRAVRVRDDRRPTSHRFDHDQAEWLRPVYGE